ncbi:MAG: hypothetical protein ACREN8_06005, partial [Candidatus Dormibacteraceae bacterium]
MKTSQATSKLHYRLRDARRERGWTQAEEAAALRQVAVEAGYPALAVDANIISRWERGIHHPKPHHLHLLTQLFDQSADQLGATAKSKSRRSSQASPAIADSPELTSSNEANPLYISNLLERVARSLNPPHPIDEHLLEALEDQIKDAYKLELTTPASVIIPHVNLLFNQLIDIWSGAAGIAPYDRVVAILGETAVLGSWLNWDNGNSDESKRFSQVALQAAQKLEDNNLRACCFGYLSYAPSCEDNPRQALELLDQALAEANPESSPLTYA